MTSEPDYPLGQKNGLPSTRLGKLEKESIAGRKDIGTGSRAKPKPNPARSAASGMEDAAPDQGPETAKKGRWQTYGSFDPLSQSLEASYQHRVEQLQRKKKVTCSAAAQAAQT